MGTKLNRADLVAAIPGLANAPKVLRGIEELPQRIDDANASATAAVDATQGIGNATVLTLSPNDAFANERVFAYGDGFTLQDAGPGKTVTLRLKYPYKINGGYRLTFNLLADTSVVLPTVGTLATTVPPGPYADDAAAAADGVNVGEMYVKTGGALYARQA